MSGEINFSPSARGKNQTEIGKGQSDRRMGQLPGLPGSDSVSKQP